MNNPFIENGFLSLNASINKLFIDVMPTDKVKQDLVKKTALDIFSTQLFIDEIKKYAKDFALDINTIEEKMLPQYLNELLEHEDLSVKEKADEIVKKFGERLGIILLTLKNGEKENKLMRKDWGSNHWEYWSNIQNVILVGGLASCRIGEGLKYYVEKVFQDSGVKCYNIILNQDSANIAIKGCATYIKNDNNCASYLIFDFGQTFMKRSIVKFENGKVGDIKNLNKVLSANVEWEFESREEERKQAFKLHEHILDTILYTVKEVENYVGDTIVISIANYVRNGLFSSRGGYGKLNLITDNYEEYLSNEIYKKIQRKFDIKLVHDGTAMAAAFSNYCNYVCLSLGTAFGVGFSIKE